MKIICDVKNLPLKFRHGILVIGVFDGLHKGHQALIRRAIQRSRLLKRPVLVMTFYPHPVNVLHPEDRLPLIISLSYRLKLIQDLGVDVAIVIRFTKVFSQLNPTEFIERYLMKYLEPYEVFVGDEFRFGQNRAGTTDIFKSAGQKHGFCVKTIHPIRRNGEVKKISSTTIRQLISEGQLKKAQALLGRRVSIMGKVIQGDRRGRLLGFPTANILPHEEILPVLGVYAVSVNVDGRRFQGMANVGRRPSFKRGGQVLLEVHIFHFHKNLYGKNIVVEFVKKIRSEKIFLSHQDLISQLHNDRRTAERILQ